MSPKSSSRNLYEVLTYTCSNALSFVGTFLMLEVNVGDIKSIEPNLEASQRRLNRFGTAVKAIKMVLFNVRFWIVGILRQIEHYSG